MNKRHLWRGAAALFVGAALAASAPLAASAHVRISPEQAAPGGYAYITFRVPTESATASTVGLQIQLPTGTPFTSVSYQAVPGWKVAVTNAKLPKPVDIEGTTIDTAPRTVTFTADPGQGIAPGEFGQFTLSLGIVPDTGSVELPSTQTYSDGSVVQWNQPTPASGVEPEHPAPTLYIDDLPPAGSTDLVTSTGSSASPTPGATSGNDSTSNADAASDTSTTAQVALVLGLVGLVLGAIALVVAVFSATRRRSGS